MNKVCSGAIGLRGAVIATCGREPTTRIAAAIAEQVAAGIPEFLIEATHLRDQLQQRLQ